MKNKIFLSLMLLFSISTVKAEGLLSLEQGSMDVLLAIVALTLLGTLFVLVRSLNMMINVNKERMMHDKNMDMPYKSTAATSSIFGKFFDNSVEMTKERDILLDHDYDGIQELDNSLPPWWVAMFYGCIAIGVVYFSYYHVFDMGLSSAEEYTMEMEAAESALAQSSATSGPAVNADNVTLLVDAGKIEQGASIYAGNCKSCHGEVGEGNSIGPNLTDKHWIHGGDIKSVFNTISEGVIEKGMLSWKATLSPKDIQKVSSFIMSLQGSNPPNAKAPQGDLIEG